ncbi:MAG: putative entry exclusion protein TrbK-alt [Novosphingobium sp.]
MSRNAKIAGIAALAGIMLAVVAVEALRNPSDMPIEAVLPLLDEGEQQKLLARELDRCATLTMPDSGCERAWAANRRRFFGKDAATDNSAGDNSRADEAIPPGLPGKYVPADQAGRLVP